MRTMTAKDVRHMLELVRYVETLTNAMRAEIRIPTAREVCDAAGAISVIRDKLLMLSLADVSVESIAPDALPERDPLTVVLGSLAFTAASRERAA